MKVETAINRILASDYSDKLKLMQLYGVALKQIPGSINQKKVDKVINELLNKGVKL